MGTLDAYASALERFDACTTEEKQDEIDVISGVIEVLSALVDEFKRRMEEP
jgi:hypothetical protein